MADCKAELDLYVFYVFKHMLSPLISFVLPKTCKTSGCRILVQKLVRVISDAANKIPALVSRDFLFFINQMTCRSYIISLTIKPFSWLIAWINVQLMPGNGIINLCRNNIVTTWRSYLVRQYVINRYNKCWLVCGVVVNSIK